MTPFEQFLAENKNKMIGESIAPTVTKPKDIERGAVQDVQVDKSQVRSTSPGIDVKSEAQQQALAMTQAAAEGKAPSFAEQLLKRQSEQALKQQASAMAGRAFDPAAVRQAQLAGAQVQMEAGSQAAAMKAQEQAQARGEFAGLATNIRGQDITQAQANQAAELQARAQDIQLVDTDLRAKMANQGVDLDILKANAARGDQASLANLESQLKTMGMNDTRIANYMSALGTSGGQDIQRQQLAMSAQQAAEQKRQFEEQLAWSKEQQRQQRADATGDWWRDLAKTALGGFVGGVGAAAGKAAVG